MMTSCAFLGDELTSLGFRLAGVECHQHAPEETAGLFRALCERVALILMTAESAGNVPADLLVQVQRAERPLVMVIPDVRLRTLPPDRVAAVRRQLGMAE